VAGIARDVIADSLRARYRSVPLDVVPDHALPSHDPDPLGALVTAAESERVRAALAGPASPGPRAAPPFLLRGSHAHRAGRPAGGACGPDPQAEVARARTAAPGAGRRAAGSRAERSADRKGGRVGNGKRRRADSTGRPR
jgi:hypothetical protein